MESHGRDLGSFLHQEVPLLRPGSSVEEAREALRGTRDGTGYIMMSFEEQPQFAQALKQNRQSAMDKDAAAF